MISEECKVLLTDHKSMIICYSDAPFPVWIWTPDEITEEEMEKVYQTAAGNFPFDEGYTFDVKYELAEYFVRNNSVFFWEDGNGKHVVSATYRPNEKGDMLFLGRVYSRKEARHKYYTENLVYQLTKKALEEGYLPVLYTNADYKPSNECFKKAGYELKGKLCTVGRPEQ